MHKKYYCFRNKFICKKFFFSPFHSPPFKKFSQSETFNKNAPSSTLTLSGNSNNNETQKKINRTQKFNCSIIHMKCTLWISFNESAGGSQLLSTIQMNETKKAQKKRISTKKVYTFYCCFCLLRLTALNKLP